MKTNQQAAVWVGFILVGWAIGMALGNAMGGMLAGLIVGAAAVARMRKKKSSDAESSTPEL